MADTSSALDKRSLDVTSVEFLLYIASGGGRVGSAIRTEYEAVFKEVLDKAEPGWTLPPLEYLKDDKHPKEWDIQEVYIQWQMRELANEGAASPKIRDANLKEQVTEEWRQDVGECAALEQICPSFCDAVSAPEVYEFFKQREVDAKTKIEEIYEKCPATEDPKGVAVVKHVVKHMGEHVGELPLCGVVREDLGTLDMVLKKLTGRVHQSVERAKAEYNKDKDTVDHSTRYYLTVRHLFGRICSAWKEAGERIGRILFDQCGASTDAHTRLCTRTNAGEYVESQVSAYICKPLKDLKCCAGDVVYFRTATVGDEWLEGYKGVHTSRPNASVYFHTGSRCVTRPVIEQYEEGRKGMVLAENRHAAKSGTHGKRKGSRRNVHRAGKKRKNKPQPRSSISNSKRSQPGFLGE